MSINPNLQDTERIKVTYNAANTTWHALHDMLESARRVGKEEPVAQYLVGAALAIRFPELTNRKDSTNHQKCVSSSVGDFSLNDTAFHVAVKLMPDYLDKCVANVAAGYNVYLLVPNRLFEGARQDAEHTLPGQITTDSIESFVSQSVNMSAAFGKDAVVRGFRRLLEKYNERVDAAEPDKSLIFEIV